MHCDWYPFLCICLLIERRKGLNFANEVSFPPQPNKQPFTKNANVKFGVTSCLFNILLIYSILLYDLRALVS